MIEFTKKITVKSIIREIKNICPTASISTRGVLDTVGNKVVYCAGEDISGVSDKIAEIRVSETITGEVLQTCIDAIDYDSELLSEVDASLNIDSLPLLGRAAWLYFFDLLRKKGVLLETDEELKAGIIEKAKSLI